MFATQHIHQIKSGVTLSWFILGIDEGLGCSSFIHQFIICTSDHQSFDKLRMTGRVVVLKKNESSFQVSEKKAN
jgi:hypothetical protein